MFVTISGSVVAIAFEGAKIANRTIMLVEFHVCENIIFRSNSNIS